MPRNPSVKKEPEKRFWFTEDGKRFYSDMTYRCDHWSPNDYTRFYITEDGQDVKYVHSDGKRGYFSDRYRKCALSKLIEQINLHLTLELERAILESE